MKIIFLEVVQDFGGARISTAELAKRLSKDHDVMILDCYGSCVPFTEYVKNSNIHLEIALARNEPFIIKGSTNPIKNLLSLLLYIPHWFKLRAKVLHIIEKYESDYVIVNNSKVLSLLLTFNRKFKTILFARGWFLPIYISKLDTFLYKNLVDKYICVSQSTRQAIYAGKLAGLKDIYVVHNAINEQLLPAAVHEVPRLKDQINILQSAGFLPDKGIEVSIEVAKVLKAKGFVFKLIITGLVYQGEASEKYFQKILMLIEQYDLINDVIIVKNCSNVIPYFRACDILIHPSNTEGLPRVIMEAMVLKKPVIANAVGGVTDYILHNFTGLITNHNNVLEYVKYIELLSDDVEKRDYLVGNAYKLINDTFNENSQIESFSDIFKQDL